MSNSFCNSALKSSPASVSLNHRNCLHGMKLAVRKTCLPTCVGEEIALTSFDICSKHLRRRDEIDWCRRGYDSGLASIALLLGVDQDQESVTPTHDDSINVATMIDEDSLIEEESLTIETTAESEEVPMKNDSVSLVLDDQSAETSSSTSEEEETTILQVSTSFNKTNDSTPLITNSIDVHIDQTMMPLDQFFTHTVPYLGNETNQSFVKDDVDISLDVFLVNELDQPDSKELFPVAISHDIVDASPIVSSIILTSITVVFFASIFIWLLAVHCWTLLHGIISCLKSTTFLGRASLTTTTRSIADTLYKQVTVLMMTIISFLTYGMNTTTSLIRILLLPIESLLNIPRFIWRVYGPGSYGRSVWHIMFNSNPKQGRKRCKVASTFNAIVQGLLNTGQASLLKMTCLLFTSARLVQVLAIISYVLVRSVAVSISKDVGVCLHTTRDALVGLIHLIQESTAKSYAIIHSAVVPFIEAIRDCLYHVRASIFGMARRTYALAIISYAIVHSVAASIFKAVGDYLFHVQSSLDGMAHWIRLLAVISYAIVHSVAVSILDDIRAYLLFIQASILGLARQTYVFLAISYTIILSVVESISKAVRGCIYSTQTFIFGMARRIQVSIIISYVLARSVAVSFSNDDRGCLYYILSPLFGILLVPRWYWKEFGPYSQGRSVFDILFKSNPQQQHRLKRGGQVTSPRLNNIETYTYHQYPLWHIYKQFHPGISSTIHYARSCIAVYELYIRVPFAAVYIQDDPRGYSWLCTFYPGFIFRCGSLDSSLHYIISYVRSLHQS